MPHVHPSTERGRPGLRPKLVLLFEEHGGNISAIAVAMGKARFQVQRWIRRLESDPRAPRK